MHASGGLPRSLPLKSADTFDRRREVVIINSTHATQWARENWDDSVGLSQAFC